MSQVPNKAGIRLVCCFCFSFVAVILSLTISRPAFAQGKTDPASSPCVPSDLNALIVREGHTIQVSPTKEGFAGKGAAVGGSGSSEGSSGDTHAAEAYGIFLREARQGNPAAMVNLGVSSLAGWGTRSNPGVALYWLHAAADRGFRPALYDLGILYFKGCGVSQDLSEAFRFFQLGARAGYTAAQVNLGYFYDHGLGVSMDPSAAVAWYRRAAESGDAQAQYNLADLYLRSEGVPNDEARAFAWFQKAAFQGHSGAQIMAGSMLAAGRGTGKDLPAAYLWIFTAKLQGDDRGEATLQVLEGQLPDAEIKEAQARAQSLLPAPKTAADSPLLKKASDFRHAQ